MGGMGEVYRAVHTRIDRMAALKVLSRTDQNPRFVQRFLNEARIHAGLHHPNIVTLYDFLEFDGKPCLVMEYVDGTTLTEHLRVRGPLPLSEAIGIFQQIVEAVSYVHEHGIVHRDIKSNNIKISTRNAVKLLDFGIAKDAMPPTLTQEGHFVGTMQYLAPEQLAGVTAGDQRADIWALGILLYEMVTAQLPFEADTVTKCISKITSVSYPPPESLNPTLPGEARAIIHRCLQKKPAHRYPTAQDLLQDTARLADVVTTLQQSTTPERQPGPRAHKLMAMGRNQWPLWVSVGVLVALITAGVFLPWQTVELVPAPVGSSDRLPLPSPSSNDASPGASNQAQQRAPVHIDTQPGRFDVYRDDRRVATTPWEFEAPIGSYFKAVLKREGFKDKEIDFKVNNHGNIYLYTLEKNSTR
jgi:serine/threonine protein kinase